jgi:hypothetical protein
MKKQKDERWLDEVISKAVDFGRVDFDKEKWRHRFILRKSDEATSSNVTYKSHYNIWRIIMESRVTRYSAAAVILLAAAVLLSPFGTPGNGGVVLADVQQKINGFETMIIRGTKTFTRPGEDGEIFEFNGVKGEFDLVKYSSKKYGLVEEGYVGDKLFYRITLNRPKRQTLLVLPLWKKYGTFTSTDKQIQLLENATPKGLINLMMKGEHKKLGRETIDGVEVEVFEFQDTEPFIGLIPKPIFDIQSLKGKIWIGIEEQLPVLIEGDFVIGKSFMSMFQELNLHEVNTLGEYNVELEEDIFGTEPPEGYTELTMSDILPLIPLEIKAGVTGLGLGFFIIPAGFIVRRRHRRKKVVAGLY